MRNIRSMTSVYVGSEDKLLMLFRVNSKVLKNSQWIGTAGGHFEIVDMNDPVKCITRELEQKTDILPSDITNLRLKYVSVKKTGNELSIIYYFFADFAGKPIYKYSNKEGSLHWFEENEAVALDMPETARASLAHFIGGGKNDNTVYTVTITDENGTETPVFVPLGEF